MKLKVKLKIKLTEVEKIQTEFWNYTQTIQDLEIELMKLRLVKLE